MRFFRATLPAVLCLAALAGLPACRHQFETVNTGKYLAQPTLRSDSTVFVAVPPDGVSKGDVVIGSGRTTADVLREAFGTYVKQAYMGRRVQTMEEALATARANELDYLAYPQILRWEDRSTELSGRRDRLDVKITIMDVDSGEPLHEAVLKGRSRWMTDGGDRPQDLLHEPVRSFVASLFRVMHTPTSLR